MATETMEQCRFKEHMTAATYVAHGLDQVAEERFELHLMECSECLDDVEAWRAIEKYMPRAASIASSPSAAARPAAMTYWRLAASIVGVALIGAASGWYGRMLSDPALAHTAFFNAPALERSADCTALRFGADTTEIALRISGVGSDRHVVALSGEAKELPSSAYSARRQADGSWIVQFAPGVLGTGALRLEARAAGAPAAAVGCFSAARAP
jgi:hypothetical protein